MMASLIWLIYEFHLCLVFRLTKSVLTVQHHFFEKMAGLVFTGFVGFLLWGLDGIGKVGIELGIYCHQN